LQESDHPKAAPNRLTVSAADSTPQQTQSPALEHNVTLLEAGKPIERELSGGETHRYQVSLAQGQYARVIVEQRGIDLLVKSFEPGGKVIAESDAEIRLNGEEKTELVAEAAGDYPVDVESKFKIFPAGRYQIRLSELRVATETDRLSCEARRQYREAFYAVAAGKYDEGQSMSDKALGIWETTVGPDNPDIARTLNLQANISYYRGDLAGAEVLYQRAIAMFGKTLGSEHPLVATSLNNLASVYQANGFSAKSVDQHRRALEIRQKALIPDHPDIAQSLNNLANAYLAMGDFDNAEPLYLRAVAINEKILSPDHLNLSFPLLNLGRLYSEKGEYSRAEPLLRRALAIRENQLSKDHPSVALVLFSLAEVYRHNGDNKNSEALYQRVLDIREKKFGPDHPDVGRCLNNLADLYLMEKRYGEAEPLFRRALAIKEIALGPAHPDTLNTLNSLAQLYMAIGNYAQGESFLTRTLAGTEHNIDLNIAIGSERQKFAYLANLPNELDRAISLHVRFAADDPAARDLAATTVLRRKGRVLDAMSDNLAVLRSRLSVQDQAVLNQLNDTTAQLARLVLNGPQKMTPEEHQKQIKILEERREKVESEVGRLSAGSYEMPRQITLSAIQATIPSDAALIEFAIYRPFDPRADSHAYGDQHYVAYITRKQGEVLWKELGEARVIDAAIAGLREALRRPAASDAKVLARSVDDMIMRPLRPLVGKATQLLVSPDGMLNLIPFEALVDENGRYLIERYSFSYLTSGRDLLRLQVPRASRSEPIVFAAPTFGEPAISVSTSRSARSRTSASRTKLKIDTRNQDLSNVYFSSLAGTAVEARTIKSLFPEATLLTGSQATESALKSVIAPRILHVATHGFFLQDAAVATVNSVIASDTRAINAIAKVENPLLRSGLALAGANTNKGTNDDGILTALEASGLNLWGTKLVTLSACDTGIGVVKNGEGVYGLRRAFTLAGTESLVMSLWPVSDNVTRELMTAYYRGLKEGLGRGDALRRVKLQILSRKDLQHPFYWASFIQSGEWANLDGKR
jgi:CHAT domain-containing protein/Tfp pilus assembly protein PilF